VSSVHELELPPGWDAPSRLRTFGLIALMAVFGLGMFVVGVGGLTDVAPDKRLFAAAFVLSGVAFTGGTVAVGRRGMRRSGVRGVDLVKSDGGTPVLRIRQPRVMQVAVAVMFLCFGGGAMLFGAAPLAAGGDPGVLMLACGAFLAGMPLVMIVWGLPEIRLDAQHVQVRSGGRRLTSAWDDLEYLYGYETRHQRLLVIAARAVERHAGLLSWATRAQRRRDAERIEIVTEQFAVHPVLLYHLLRFYQENPLARTELGTAAALQRLRGARLAAP